MREIKFRVWDKEDKTFYYQNEQKLGSFFDHTVYPIGDNIVQQFTGLKDKEGKDVYEGDIIEDFFGDRRKVEFVNGGFWCSYPNGEHYLPMEDKMEVIGNVCENPELISI